MLKEELHTLLDRIDKLNELYRETYRNYRDSRNLYKNTDLMSEEFRRSVFTDYAKNLEAVCVLDNAMAILLPTEDIEKEVDYENEDE